MLADGGDNGFLIRKNSPQLKAALDDFVKRYGQGTTFGNSVVNRYVKDPKFVKNAVGGEEVRRFGEVVGLFRKYGDKYDVDHLLMVAQGFQESGARPQREEPGRARSGSCRSCRPPGRS